jgi:hypothetical protein
MLVLSCREKQNKGNPSLHWRILVHERLAAAASFMSPRVALKGPVESPRVALEGLVESPKQEQPWTRNGTLEAGPQNARKRKYRWKRLSKELVRALEDHRLAAPGGICIARAVCARERKHVVHLVFSDNGHIELEAPVVPAQM